MWQFMCERRTASVKLKPTASFVSVRTVWKKKKKFYCHDSGHLYPSFNTFCHCVQKKSIKGVLLHLNEHRNPNGLDENPHLV